MYFVVLLGDVEFSGEISVDQVKLYRSSHTSPKTTVYNPVARNTIHTMVMHSFSYRSSSQITSNYLPICSIYPKHIVEMVSFTTRAENHLQNSYSNTHRLVYVVSNTRFPDRVNTDCGKVVYFISS